MADIRQGDLNITQSVDMPLRTNKRFVSHIQSGATTPSVKDLEHIILNHAGPTTITNLKNGRDGQPLKIISLNGNATIANNANIVTNTGANKLLTANLVYRFTFHKATGKWHEDA